MGDVILGTGSYAVTPYFVEKLYVNLYSVEELCYLLVENAEVLDQEIMDRNLVRWLDEQCGLNQLAHTLDSLLNQEVSTVAFIGTILEYVNLYPEEVIRQTENAFRENEGLNPYERGKAKADYLLSSRRYFAAQRQYYMLLSRLPETENGIRSAVYHNMGVACAGMFLYRQAAEYFMKAYETDGNEDSLLHYLAAQRMFCQDKEYIAFIAENPQYHDASLKVERLVEKTLGQFEETDENRMLFALQVSREEGNSAMGVNMAYYDEIEQVTHRLKEEYRGYIV